ncbi:MAG: hypothetical protein C0173_00130 [Desulfurella sp.]|uniref:hypothetical protein n=1 Tax=Desulfurella sp. TaxID=1962857 RepID=UPI000CAB0B85|nr:hypothetical protein [Desulfurella sp.]PMP93696.1 MAG: hypothetical protein C0173_00130 [Desulfurella sp.]HEX13136.1 hypothetical protein [Desulfurella acetivorans]
MDIVESLKNLFKERLQSVCLHNLGISASISKNGILVVLDRVLVDDIKLLKQHLKKFKKLYISPLLFEVDFLEQNKDYFCMEILELKENIKVLYGKNPVQNIDIESQALRNQIKREIASKMLAVRSSFLELTLERKTVEDIAYRSLYNFYLISKYILYLLNIKQSQNVFEDVEKHFLINLENTKKLFFMPKRPTFDKLLPLFENYLKELENFLKIKI